MAHPARQLFALLELLQDRPSVTGVEAAAHLEVDVRTVRRYVANLQRLEVPVRAARGPGGGYRLAPGYRMPPLMLTVDQAVAAVVALTVAATTGGAVAGPAALQTLTKLRRILPLRRQAQVQALEARMSFTARPRTDATLPLPATLLTLADAAERRRRVTCGYTRHDGRTGQRTLSPYGVVLHGARWYAVARDEERGELRVLRTDRMASVRLGAPGTPAPAGLDAATFVATTLARVPWGWDVEVLLEAPLDRVSWRIGPGYGELTEVDAGVVLQIRFETLDDAAGLLADLGCPFVIRRPDELRDAIEQRAHELLYNARR